MEPSQEEISPEPAWHSEIRRSHWTLLAIVLVYALGVRLVLIDRPFSRNAEGVGAFYGVLARNYLRYPLSVTHGVPVQSIGQAMPPTYYAHHPPLVPLFIAGSYAIFGQGEWQTRLPTALFTLACIVMLFRTLARRGGPMAGLLAAALFAAVPMTVFYGGHPDCINPQLVFFCLVCVECYFALHRRPSTARLLAVLGSFTLAVFTDWPACFLVPVLCGHWAITKPPRAWAWAIAMGLGCALAFLAAYGHVAITLHDWGWMKDKFARRALSTESDRLNHFDWSIWLSGVAAHNRARHTAIVVVLAVLWAVLWGARRRGRTAADTLAILLLAFAAIHILVGRQGVYVHDWWWWVLTPGLVTAAAIALARAANLMGRCRGAALLIAGMIAFATWTTWRTMPQFFEPKPTMGGVDYTTTEVGDAIRAAAPDGGAVVLSYNDAYDLPLWFYGDRPLMLGVWDTWTLGQRQSGGFADLPFGFRQHWPDPPVGLVFPAMFEDAAPAFVQELTARYPMRRLGRFMIFDLSSPIAAPASQPR